MPSIRTLARIAATALLASALNVFASPITFIFTGSGSGTLAGNAFGAATPVSFTITGIADTANVVSCGAGCLFVDHASASINITGVGSLTFLTGTRTFFNDGSDTVGFSRSGTGGADLYDSGAIAALNGYGLTTAVGPLASNFSTIQWALSPVNTSGGVLVLNNRTAAGTFQAITTQVPEPGTLALTATVLLGLATVRRTRRA